MDPRQLRTRLASSAAKPYHSARTRQLHTSVTPLRPNITKRVSLLRLSTRTCRSRAEVAKRITARRGGRRRRSPYVGRGRSSKRILQFKRLINVLLSPLRRSHPFTHRPLLLLLRLRRSASERVKPSKLSKLLLLLLLRRSLLLLLLHRRTPRIRSKTQSTKP